MNFADVFSNVSQYAAIPTSYNPPITVYSSSPCNIPGSNLE